MSFTYRYPRPALTVDCVVFGIGAGAGAAGAAHPELQVLLVERRDEPHKGGWALPGGFVEVSDDGGQGEALEAAAQRELAEETGLRVDYLEQLYTFGRPGRDPRGRVVSVAYYALVRSAGVSAGSDARAAKWWPVSALVQKSRGEAVALAFDHAEILQLAVARLRAKVRYAPVGFHLLPRHFALSELQKLYEAILMRELDRPNFRRRILAMGILAEVGQQENVPHRAATLYRFDRRAYDRAVREGFDFDV
jgi:8-oxo-dGTP diphosphatase